MDFFPAIIRPLEPDDILTVVEIAKSAMAYPWSEGVFRDCMTANYHGWVIRDDRVADGKTLGFLIILDQMSECQLINVCVLPKYQCRGYGRQLLEHMIEYAQTKDLYRVSLEVRASNKAAISVYRALGFIAAFASGVTAEAAAKEAIPVFKNPRLPFLSNKLITSSKKIKENISL